MIIARKIANKISEIQQSEMLRKCSGLWFGLKISTFAGLWHITIFLQCSAVISAVNNCDPQLLSLRIFSQGLDQDSELALSFKKKYIFSFEALLFSIWCAMGLIVLQVNCWLIGWWMHWRNHMLLKELLITIGVHHVHQLYRSHNSCCRKHHQTYATSSTFHTSLHALVSVLLQCDEKLQHQRLLLYNEIVLALFSSCSIELLSQQYYVLSCLLLLFEWLY